MERFSSELDTCFRAYIDVTGYLWSNCIDINFAREYLFEEMNINTTEFVPDIMKLVYYHDNNESLYVHIGFMEHFMKQLACLPYNKDIHENCRNLVIEYFKNTCKHPEKRLKALLTYTPQDDFEKKCLTEEMELIEKALI